MKEQNRRKLQLLAQRYQQRAASRQVAAEADLRRDFERLCEQTVAPLMAEVAAELRRAGHSPTVVRREHQNEPAIELELGLSGDRQHRNVVGFTLIRWQGHPLQILAYLEAKRPPPFDLERFQDASEVRPDLVEQLLVDAVEHIITCNAP